MNSATRITSISSMFILLILSNFVPIRIFAQKLCKFSVASTLQPSNSSLFVQNFSTEKCLSVTGFGFKSNSKVVLDECSYWTKVAKHQQFALVGNTLNKSMLKTDAGRGETYCLTTKDDILINTFCDPKSFDQSWTVKAIQGHSGQFLIEQYSSKKCLMPKTRTTGSVVQLLPCNSHQTEQIWKICE